MKREVLIIAGVLVPFAVLVGAAFHFAPVTPSMPPAAAPVLVSPLPDPLPLRGEGNVDASVPAPVATVPDQFPPELAAPLSAVLPQVRRCFLDQRLKTRREVKVRFTPTRDGGFEQVSVDEQNPYLAACLEDVFAEIAWQPDGRQTFAPATHTFSFGPSPD